MSDVEVAQTSSVDLISNLPPDVTEKILGNLPLQDAVRTGILSTYWRNQWASLSHIILDQEFFTTVLKGGRQAFGNPNEYIDIVDNVLRCHVGPLRKLVLYLSPFFARDENYCHWLCFVSEKGGLTDLTLIIELWSMNLSLPWLIFCFTTLKRLALCTFEILALPQTFTGFPCLEILEVSLCRFNSSRDLERFISSCPQLRHLKLGFYRAFALTIHAPKLEYLVVNDLCFTHICLGNSTTKIKVLDLTCVKGNERQTPCLSEIESLCLGSLFGRDCEHPPRRGEGALRQLETLNLNGIPLDCPYAIDSVLDLLDSSLNLQRLYICSKVIPCGSCKSGTHTQTPSCNVSGPRKGKLPSLKYVELMMSSVSSLELGFMKIILKSAPVLETLTVGLYDNIKEEEAMELMEFPRASTNAKIIFKVI